MSHINNFFQNFRNILSLPCMLGREGAPNDLTAFFVTKDGFLNYYSPKGNPSFDLKIGPLKDPMSRPNGGLRGSADGIKITTAGVFIGVDYLPWLMNQVSFMLLNANGRLFFTGPVEGCYIYAAKALSHYYTFHINANDVGDANANDQAKRQRFELARQKVASFVGNVPMEIWEATPAQYKPNDGNPYRGFCFGINHAGGWKFYYHSISLGDNSWIVHTACGDFVKI